MRTAAYRYHRLLTTSGVARVMLGGLIGRLPIGMSTLLFVLVVHDGTGSYALAGYAAALNGVAVAVTAPALGRLADRGHAASLLALTGIAQAAGLVALVIVLRAGATPPLILAISAVAGLVNPPVGAVVRTVLPRLARDEQVRATAFAVDAVTVDLTYVLGPALVGIVSAIWDGYTATLTAAGLIVAGALMLATAPAVHEHYPVVARRSMGWWANLVGPLRGAAVRMVLLVTLVEAAAYGVLEVAIPAYATGRGVPEAGGILFAVWSAGSIVGGLWFGARSFTAPLGRQYQILMTFNILGFGSMLLAGNLVSLGGLLFLAGLVIAPTTAVESALVTQLAPATATTEAMTWSGTAMYLGFAGGSALTAAVFASSLGSPSAMTGSSGLATALVAAGALVLLARGRLIAASS